MSSPDLKHAGLHSQGANTCTLAIEPGEPKEDDFVAPDYYEILRVSPQADQDTIERVYRTLAERFHPDNIGTGDRTAFLRLGEAYDTISNSTTRAKYNASRQCDRGSVRFWLRGREFFDGVSGGQNRRSAVLCLLYRTRIANFESAGLTILDLERSTGWTREEVTSAVWYLCEKKWGTLGESTAYSITVDGFDVVESKLNDRLEFRALATWCNYGLPSELDDRAYSDPDFQKKDILPLDVGHAGAVEGDGSITDHYESLGIGQQADEEVIERVYVTLAGRFHPDNPSTGDVNTFLRVREAYNTLSDKTTRANYDALRQRTKHSARFRLRGREFFDGIEGEQLRRLAVLCLLYRQAVSDSPGLTVLDMEPLTGCTREELGSALWYLREKKWAKSGGYSEYTITAEGFDVVENEAASARSQQNALGPIQPPKSNTIARENQNSHRIAETAQSNIAYKMPLTSLGLQYLPSPPPVVKVEVPPKRVEVAPYQAPAPIDGVPGLAEQGTEFGAGSESPSQSPQNVLGNPQSPVSNPIAASMVETVVSDTERGAGHSWSGLAPGDIRGNEPSNQQATASQTAAQSQANVEVTPQSQDAAVGSSTMAVAAPTGGAAMRAAKRVVLSMGGKGGVGKTSVMTGLAEWFEENQIPVTMLDLDTENKAIGSLAHFFAGRVPKINIHTPAGLDSFVDNLAEDAPVILADMGAGAGQVTHDWFDKMYPDVSEAGVAFTAIGVITSDPASVESVLNWVSALQDRADYIIVRNHLTEHSDFTYWNENDQAEEFRQRFQPATIRLDYRLADLENAVRNHGATLGQVANRTTSARELQKASLVMRAQSYRRRMFLEFDKVKDLLLP